MYMEMYKSLYILLPFSKRSKLKALIYQELVKLDTCVRKRGGEKAAIITPSCINMLIKCRIISMQIKLDKLK
jgi:hypothetical protein